MQYALDRIHKQKKIKKDARVYVVTAVFFLIAGVLLYRLFNLQVLQHGAFAARSDELHNIEKELKPVRGQVMVSENGETYPIITNKDYYFVYADPRKIEDKQHFIDTITPILGLKEEEWKDLLAKVSKENDPYEPIRRKVELEDVQKIKDAELSGVYNVPESYRMYPEGIFGGHILGFVDYNGEGKYGIEGYYNQELTGVGGVLKSAKDATGRSITIGEREVKRPVNGSKIILTIDRKIQVKICDEIKKGVEGFGAKTGTIIVMEPYSGAVVGMCSYPDFDPEKYNEVENINIYNNPAIFSAYEPGSIFKAITLAIGIDEKKITPYTTYEDTGEIKLIGLKPIRNSDLQAHGIQTMTQVLEKSLNTGAVFVANKIGNKDFRKYVQNFGFGENTGISLDTEVPGDISSLDKRGDIYTITASFGQGITVTPLQFISAFSALVNGGKLMKPHIVEEIIHEDGSTDTFAPTTIRQVISQSSSSAISGMLVSVVENGWGGKAGVEGYYVGGKTGTAQVAGKDGEYGEETIHSFVGFGPARNPKFVILVKLDEPQSHVFSSDTATTIFRKVASYLFQMYDIEPER